MVRGGSSVAAAKSPSHNGLSSTQIDVLSMAIMETIRRIRAQKQRPSLERISKWVMNHTPAKQCSFEQVQNQLEDLSKSGRVLKVFNQGEYSYRDPETMNPRTCGRTPKHWRDKHRGTPSTPKTPKSPLSSPTSPKIASPELTLIPRNSLMRHKTLQVADYIKLVEVSLDGLGQPQGATIKDMDKYLESTYYIEGISAIEFSRHLRLACKRLVHGGRLIRDGMIFRLSPNIFHTHQESKKNSNGAIEKQQHAENESSSTTSMLVCSYCCGTDQCNKEGKPEVLLSCVECGNSGHPSCMKVSPRLAAKIQNQKWQCIECKSCQACGSKGNADNLLFCDSCDRGMHMECCDPPLTRMPKGSFYCESCKNQELSGKKKNDHLKSSSRGPGRPPNAQRRLMMNSSPSQHKSPGISRNNADEKTREVLSESGQHFLKVPFDKKPKGLIDGMTKFFTPSMGGRKTMTSQARTTQLMIMRNTHENHPSPVVIGNQTSHEDEPMKESTEKSCKANITEMDENMFFRAREESLQRTGVVEEKPPDPSSVRCPESIEFGKYSIETWYSSPYPQEYARLKKLYLCEFCLKYMKSQAILERHAKKCQWFHPPANEIYRSNNLSVFEVDGNVSKIYCQNLCLLAKMFLDHKTLYYDVEPFSFYCLTINDSKGCHLIGYFSKEKHSQQKYNVSCIMTLPQYQRKGYGRFLIDFSYLLSRKEGQAGSPEKPLSDLGQVSYNAYWRSILLAYLSRRRSEKFLSLRDISKSTGICPHDIATTLQILGMIRITTTPDTESSTKIKFNLSRKRQLLTEYLEKQEKIKNDPHRPPKATVDPDCLRWTPLVASTSFLSDESGLQSPSGTPEKRVPLAPTSRLNLGSSMKKDRDNNDHSTNDPKSSDIENIKSAESSLSAVNHKPNNAESANDDVTSSQPITNADISKGFLPTSGTPHRKRGRPRKHQSTSVMDAGIFSEDLSGGSFLSLRKKRRRKVKGYPWGRVKKKKKKIQDASPDKLDVSDADTKVPEADWRLGGPHFSSESDDEGQYKEEEFHRRQPGAAISRKSRMDACDLTASGETDLHPDKPQQFLKQTKKRKRRKSKGYQWGAIKRKVKKSFSTTHSRAPPGGIAVRRKDSEATKMDQEGSLDAADGKRVVQTTMDRFFRMQPSSQVSDYSFGANCNKENKGIALSDAINDSKHIVVASVTLSPSKSSSKHPTSPHPFDDKHHKSRRTSSSSLELETKKRRRSAIAGDNFVASCLLSSRSPRRGMIPEKKRPRGRPRINFPPELEDVHLEAKDPPMLKEDQSKESSPEQGDAFANPAAQIANDASSKKAEGTVAFAKLWISNLPSGSSNISQGGHSSFTLANEGRFKDISFKSAIPQSYTDKGKMKSLNWHSPSLTTYRDRNRIKDEDNSSSSSSDAESSSCSSAESSYDNSTDEESQNNLGNVDRSHHHQWRGIEKPKHLMKRRGPLVKSKDSGKTLPDAGAARDKTSNHKPVVVKRGRGRPRKYPRVDDGDVEKTRRKEEKAEKSEIKLTVHRTNGGYRTTHTEDRIIPASKHNNEDQLKDERSDNDANLVEKVPHDKVNKVEDIPNHLSDEMIDSVHESSGSDDENHPEVSRKSPPPPKDASEITTKADGCHSPTELSDASVEDDGNDDVDDEDDKDTDKEQDEIPPDDVQEEGKIDMNSGSPHRDEDAKKIDWKLRKLNRSAEEEANEINAAVASITQSQSSSPFVAPDYHEDPVDDTNDPPPNKQTSPQTTVTDSNQMMSNDDYADSPDGAILVDQRSSSQEDVTPAASDPLQQEMRNDEAMNIQDNDFQSSYIQATLPQISSQQCQFSYPPAENLQPSTNSEPPCVQTYHQSDINNFPPEIFQQPPAPVGGYQGNSRPQQPAYEGTYNENQPIYNASCMTSSNNIPPPQCDVMEDGHQTPMTSPKGNYPQQAVGPSPCAANPMAAPCPPGNPPIQPQVPPHGHGYPAGGSGSTSGYETLSNNSCSPYTSPESLNPGSCDHTITTTASVPHMEVTTYPSDQAGAGGMSVGVQPPIQTTPVPMYSAPSIDSGHGSEYLSSPPSHGPSTQGTPPKTANVPQAPKQTLLGPPDPFTSQTRPQQQVYNNLPSPNMTSQNRSSCAVGDSLNMIPFMSPATTVGKAPPTPQCSYPCGDDGFGGADHSPSPKQNSLMKLQKLTGDVTGTTAPSSNAHTSSSSQKDSFQTPQATMRRPRYTSTGIPPDRPSSVQPQGISPKSVPHPSTPPATLNEPVHTRDTYYQSKDPYRRVTGDFPHYPYTYTRPLEERLNAGERYPSNYDPTWPGAFGNYPTYPSQAPHGRIDQHGGFGSMPTQKLIRDSGANYPGTPSNPMLVNRHSATWGAREHDPYNQNQTYPPGLGVRTPFPGHDVRHNLHPHYTGNTYPSYPGQASGYYGNNFPHR